MTGNIFDLKRFALHDGPGIRTTVFFKGCSLSCWWCHNPESRSPRQEYLFRPDLCAESGHCIPACPEDAVRFDNAAGRDVEKCILCGACAEVCPSGAREIVGSGMTADEVMRRIERDVPFFDESGGGVTFSGGEPVQQAEFLLELLKRCGACDIHRAVDTSGFAPAETLRAVARETDLFLYDLKLMDSTEHEKFAGVPNALILSNLRMLVEELGAAVRVCLPVIPGISDTPENIRASAAFLASLDPPPPVTLLAYHPMAAGKYQRFGLASRLDENTAAPTAGELDRIAEEMRGHGLVVKAGGR